MRGNYRGGGGGFRGRGNGPPAPVPLLMGPPVVPQNQPGPPGPPRPAFNARQPCFDVVMANEFFPKVTDYNDTILTQEIVNRAIKLTPGEVERGHHLNALQKTLNALAKIKSDEKLLPGVLIEEYQEIGSSKKDTILAGHKALDICVVLKSMPIIESVHSLGQKVGELIRAEREVLSVQSRDFGCLINFTSSGVKINLLIGTIAANAKQLEEGLHIGEKLMLRHLAAARHVRWWEEAAAGSPVKDLVRVFKDLRSRYQGLKPLNVWAIEFLCHFCMVHGANRQPLPLGLTFMRVLQLLASGLFLPGSVGLADPCDVPNNFLQQLNYEEMDTLCSTAQTLIRVLGHGGYQRILGTSLENIDVTRTPTFYMTGTEKVVVTPLDRAYDEEEMKELQPTPA